MSARVLRLHRGPVPVPTSRTQGDIGDGAISLGLISMVHRIGDPANRGGLVLSSNEVADITAGLTLGATPRQRETALQVVAENHADWTATPGGRTEVLSLVTWLAPYCPDSLWQEIVAEMAAADDPRTDADAHAAAEARLFAALRRAVRLDDRVIQFPGRHRAPEGPGAA